MKSSWRLEETIVKRRGISEAPVDFFLGGILELRLGDSFGLMDLLSSM